jgi:prepilin-type N-terminal cleavage/methylation domain-containing protein/prepilin-type processing-associated H-X9-DG protein
VNQHAGEGGRRAFSLIELLVVISIIAVLASMLMVAVKMVRQAATASACLSQERQLGLALNAYAGEFDGQLRTYFATGGCWMDLMAPYLESAARARWTPAMGNALDLIPGVERIFSCPAARRPRQPGEDPWPTAPEVGTATRAWGNHVSATTATFNNHLGSYGLNAWLLTLPTINSFRPSEMPAWGDSIWVYGKPKNGAGFPTPDQPPTTAAALQTGTQSLPWTDTNEMRQFCIDRHRGQRVNQVFVDGHAASVTQADLWNLMWSPQSQPQVVVIPR